MEQDTDNDEGNKTHISWVGYDDKKHSRVVPSCWAERYLAITKGMTRDRESISSGDVF